MGTPKGNGLVEITGENKSMDKGWFCMDWDTFHSAYQQAKSGNCPFKDKCKRYERTVKKRGHQLSIF